MSAEERAEPAGAAGARGLAPTRPLAPARSLTADEEWALANLRWRANAPIVDLANVVRILERHPDFQKRFKYNDVLTKVMDRGAVMLEWRINDITAIIQERFIPEAPVDMVSRALLVVSNRGSA